MADGLESHDDCVMSDQEWKKLQLRSHTDGYREGFAIGKENALQSGFDAGYATALKVSQFYAKLRGRLAVNTFTSSNHGPLCVNKEPLSSNAGPLSSEKDSLTIDKKSEDIPSDNDILVSSERKVLNYIKNNFSLTLSAELNVEEWIGAAGENLVIEKINNSFKSKH
ncbi:uncharacterized protein LOC111697940 [Eurytemora carolleeae]|uniref:uncharacterized protein LOC111697940 n=1 Tax=Eurytemora carolleeae TaxID=1294199 RepID=UPI000C78E86F|nr:uncharacterized protein LOC111697940 [Eurytemora carolleeae]|eukprot:XP_023323880.1 uncharacterized protein LOC111697940 [Eurytemora affinis]